MPTLTFNGKEYDLDKVSSTVRAHANSIAFVDSEIQRLEAQLAVCNTAKRAYLRELSLHLDVHDAEASSKQ